MHPCRPRWAPWPCPGCGRPVDPLRAPRLVATEFGVRALCGRPSCLEARLRWAERLARELRDGPDVEGRASARAVAPPAPRTGSATGTVEWVRSVSPTAWMGVASLLLAVAAAALGGEGKEVLGAALSAVAAAAFVAGGGREGEALDVDLRGIGLLGVALLALSAVFARDPVLMQRASWSAMLAAAALGLRVAALRWDRRPVRAALGRLRKAPGGYLRPEDSSSASVAPFVPVASARAGERIVVRAGEAVPLDGVVDRGEGEALLHPEARHAVRRGPGDPLLAGARLLSGEVRLLVTRVGGERGLLRPARFGENPPEALRRLPWRLGLERGWADALVVLVALLAFTGQGGGVTGTMVAGAVLAAAPLLGLRSAVRAPWVAAAAAAAEHGIVYRDEEAMERAGRVRVVAFARRGVVTEGRPLVASVERLEPGREEADLLGLAAGLEQAAEGDPIAEAVLRRARGAGVAPATVRRARVVPGRGIAGIGPDGEPVALGNRHLLIAEGVGGAMADDLAAQAERRGATVLLLAEGGRVRGLLTLHDETHPGARPAIQRLFDLGADVVLMSGDHRGTVEAQAAALGVVHVEAELTPEERGEAVERLAGSGGTVGAVGRSPEHDPMLLQAEVPAVLGAAGAPAGDRGIGLAGDDPREASVAFWLAHAASRASRQGMVVAFALGGGALAALALGVFGPLGGIAVGLAADLWVVPASRRLHARARRVLERIAEAAAERAGGRTEEHQRPSLQSPERAQEESE